MAVVDAAADAAPSSSSSLKSSLARSLDFLSAGGVLRAERDALLELYALLEEDFSATWVSSDDDAPPLLPLKAFAAAVLVSSVLDAEL